MCGSVCVNNEFKHGMLGVNSAVVCVCVGLLARWLSEQRWLLVECQVEAQLCGATFI